jgi:hypothetical protein
MARYRVLWSIEVDTDSPYHAAVEALRVQRDPESIATVFVVDDLEGDKKYMLDVTNRPIISVTEH